MNEYEFNNQLRDEKPTVPGWAIVLAIIVTIAILVT